MMTDTKTPAPQDRMPAVNWENADDPVVKLFVGYDVEGYVAEYELCGDDGDYSPNQQERILLVDAIYGVLSNLHEALRKLIPSAPAPQDHLPVVSDAVEAVWEYSLVIESSVRRGDGPEQYAGVVEALRLIKVARAALALPTPERPVVADDKTVNAIMEQAQVFASTYSLVGGRFDDGSKMQQSEDDKADLRRMIEIAISPAPTPRERGSTPPLPEQEGGK